MARGVDGRAIYADDEDRERFLRMMRIAIHRGKGRVIAYCLMGNHFHLAVSVSSVPLSKIMHRLLTSYALSFNERHGRAGHLFQARFKDKLCTSERYLAAIIRYIHENPVRAGLVEHPGDWAWSSWRPDRDNGPPLPEHFDAWRDEAEAVPPPTLIRAEVESKDPFESIAERLHATGEALRSPSSRNGAVELRARFAREASDSGHDLTEIARWLGMTEGSVRYYLRRTLRSLRA